MLLAGCQPQSTSSAKPPPEKKVELRLPEGPIGHWDGEAKPLPGGRQTPTASTYLSERLGGFSLDIFADGSFECNFRGLTKSGTWSQAPLKLNLSPDLILGERKDQSKMPDLFSKDNILLTDSQWNFLLLKSNDPDSANIEFKKTGAAQKQRSNH